MLINVLG